MSLNAYLAAGVGLAGMAGAAEAAIVNIDLTDTRGDGIATTDDNVAGLNAGLSVGGTKAITDWLGAGTGTLVLFSDFLNSGGYDYWGLDGNPNAGFITQFSTAGSGASPTNFATGASINSAAGGWSDDSFKTLFRYDYAAGVTQSPDFGAGSYMGFRFGTGSNYYYGWLEVTWSGSTQNWQILSGSYETTVNTAINAGQGAASVPAPSPASLLALIVGGAALRQWRAGRRKQQLLEQTAA
jgi:hypothetical protein